VTPAYHTRSIAEIRPVIRLRGCIACAYYKLLLLLSSLTNSTKNGQYMFLRFLISLGIGA